MSENSIEFSLSNSEQRDSWLNSGHWTLDANKWVLIVKSRGIMCVLCYISAENSLAV